jgi:hypothetical protein
MNQELKNKIIELLELENLPEEEKETLLADIGENISRQVFLDSYDTLTPENQQLIKNALEINDAAIVAQILSTVENQEEIIENATEKILEDLVNVDTE